MDNPNLPDAVAKLRAARAQGLLDPIIEFIERSIRDATMPERPTGPEWPYERAWRDGELSAYVKTLRWIDGRSKPSPDAAENTGG